MTDEALRQKAAKYSKLFASAGVGPEACDLNTKGPNARQIASHAMWMCKRVPSLLVEGKGDQAREWVRFVEGILWSMGAMSFRDMTEGVVILG